jgi:VIT1/CCC1 family predicted Fe2+/Mn2+ transporter
MPHHEYHRIDRIGWLRAALLGANDGLISTASLIVGMAVAAMPASSLLLAALAGLVAGALSMAAGEFVSVSSQADTEKADLAREHAEIIDDPAHELDELTAIYVGRGVSEALARQVATEMMAHDALGAHARDELGLFEGTRANPLQAAVASALSFAAGAVPPLVLVLLVPGAQRAPMVAVSSLILLALLGGVAGRLGGASMLTGAGRVAFWGAVAMGATALVGQLFGAQV